MGSFVVENTHSDQFSITLGNFFKVTLDPTNKYNVEMGFYRPTTLVIDLKKLQNNFQFLKSLASNSSFICPMIKANAYGHGDVAVARVLGQQGCSAVGVSSVEEAVRLRSHGFQGEILVFGFSGQGSVVAIIDYDLTAVVSDEQQLQLLKALVCQPLKIHLKLNTGMNRLGFNFENLTHVVTVLKECPLLKVDGLGTHFHSGFDISEKEGSSQRQLIEFTKSLKLFSEFKVKKIHAYNSAAISSLFDCHMNFEYGLRPGLLAYGIDPMANERIRPLISPVMEFKSKIVATQRVKCGEVVSYDGTWRADRDSLIGVVPAGYADGVCRSLSNRGHFLIGGRRVPVRGLVCMDYTMVDLTELPNRSWLEETVTLIGSDGDQQISVADMASLSGRSIYEIVTGISDRVPRIYKD